ncbi:metalloregulator ArsR/SmtB family transcription factor [Nocardioides sp. SYSU D00065]|uniref:ArsR/SmtB family transcription factor n=1 Tax=Nocardioides sp. SYSU D00065 TaxID=2817378 RepID=UPI0027DBFC3A|nr:metalloregulator ArsR/SmtB family transcription factor [Nocardioides sp. SYSU D00065]
MTPGDEPARPGLGAVAIDHSYGPVADVFAALAAPVRAAIVHRLTSQPQTVAELVEFLGASQPLVSQHLTRLKHAGLVEGERHGRNVVYRIADDHVAHVFLDALHHSAETGSPA